MRILAVSSPEEIEHHLVALGAGNHSDNLEQIRAHKLLYRADIVEADFWELVFLETDATRRLTRASHDRRLRAVARAARALGDHNLGSNWDLHTLMEQTEAIRAGRSQLQLPTFLLRDAR